MPRANLRQIEAFKAVLECGGVSRAAEVLHVSQPAVSKLIGHFEHTIGFALFDRIKGRLVATAEGQLLYEEIDRVFAGIEQITRTADAIRSSRSGQLRVGAMPGLSTGFIQSVTIPFMATRPDIHLEIHSRSSQVLINWLVNRQIDVAFPNSMIEHADVESEVLARHRLVCLLPKGHALANRRTVTPEALAQLSIISFADGSLIAARVARTFAEAKVPLKKRMMATSASTVCGYVAGGVGFAVVDPLHIPPDHQGLSVRDFAPAIENELVMAIPRGRRSNALTQAFAADARRLVNSRRAARGRL
jgi:DNA-binding transcriptional LysR family regulator